MTIFGQIGMAFVIIWEMFHGKICLNSVLLLLLVNFCESQVRIDAYIPYHKYHVKPHSSPWFSTTCATAMVDRNHFFCLYQQNNSSESKVKFWHDSNRCKRILESVKIAYDNKAKESIFFQKLSLQIFVELLIAVWRCCLLHLIKWSYLLETFLRTLILMTLASLYLFSLL